MRGRGFKAQRNARTSSSSRAPHDRSQRNARTSSSLRAPYDRERSPQRESNWCNICSFKQQYPRELLPVHHKHFSSRILRSDILGINDTVTPFYCPSCKSRHRAYTEDRIKVVVSDSTLHQFFAPLSPNAPEYEGDLVHVDYITIEGGLIPELLLAFKYDYVDVTPSKPLDVVLVAGCQDVAQGFAREFILRGMQEFAHTVLSSNREVRNTFAVASLAYPPSLCWFRDNGPVPYNYTNHKDKVDWLNHEIHNLNLDNNVPIYPGFHTYGLRVTSRTIVDNNGVRQTYRSKAHRFEHWKETSRREKFTLKEERKFKMGKALNHYFQFQTMN